MGLSHFKAYGPTEELATSSLLCTLKANGLTVQPNPDSTYDIRYFGVYRIDMENIPGIGYRATLKSTWLDNSN